MFGLNVQTCRSHLNLIPSSFRQREFNKVKNCNIEVINFNFLVTNTPGGGTIHILVRGSTIGKGIDFHDFCIRNGIDFHDFGIRNGINFHNFRNWYTVGYANSENWYEVRYIFLKNWYKVGYTFWKIWYKERVCF